MRRLQLFAFALATLILAPACGDPEEPSSSAEAMTTTSTERAMIMDGLRARVKAELADQDVVFNVSQGTLRVSQGFAWLMGHIELRSGGAPTTAGTPFESKANDGLFDGFRIEALLEKRGAGWEVVEHGIGTTDVWYDGIETRHPNAPRALFPHLDGQASPAPSERMAIMNGLRSKVKPELANQDIVFNVSARAAGAYRTGGDFAWVVAVIELRGGGEPTTKSTLFEGAAQEGRFAGFHVQALLKKDGNGWAVVEHAVGSPDEWFLGIETRVPGVPRSIFPHLDPH
jgi:hypothetical protein